MVKEKFVINFAIGKAKSAGNTGYVFPISLTMHDGKQSDRNQTVLLIISMNPLNAALVYYHTQDSLSRIFFCIFANMHHCCAFLRFSPMITPNPSLRMSSVISRVRK